MILIIGIRSRFGLILLFKLGGMSEIVNIEVTTCYHCGEACNDKTLVIDDKLFCCEGCKLVYEILEENDLCTYYNLDNNPGINIKSKYFGEHYAYLDNKEIVRQLSDYVSDTTCKITFYIPSIHCSSCIWLLENLYRLRDGVSASRVNFVRKELSVTYDSSVTSLKKLVELLATIGYAPDISLENYTEKTKKKDSQSIFLKIGITGFCTGNIMLLSFPEYFGLHNGLEAEYRSWFTWLNLILALPVFFYGGSGYLISAYKSLREKTINLDVPLSIGIVALFGRSLYETLSGIGPGYWDSLGGLIFFLLLGKWLQNKTFENLSFNRNYKSYFPLAVTIEKEGSRDSVPVTELSEGDHMVIRNQELIPADSILLSPQAWIDYSFVTGESDPVEKNAGDYIYAGGRQIGAQIELAVQKPVSQSYLTQLWNNDAFAKEKITPVTELASGFSRYFTYVTLSVAGLTAIFWSVANPEIMWQAFTAVLIVACPCALSLSMPFTMENTMRIFGKKGFYVKNTGIIQHLASISHIIFDKTGTLTHGNRSEIIFVGQSLNDAEQQMIKSMTANSIHPLSRKLFNHFKEYIPAAVSAFREETGRGMEGFSFGHHIKMGSKAFAVNGNGSTTVDGNEKNGSVVFLTIDNNFRGYFLFKSPYRAGLKKVMADLKTSFKISLLSGDRKVDVPFLAPLFGSEKLLHFQKSPSEKLNFIKDLQSKGEKVLMIGDGLNDAGALKQSNVGMVLTEDVQAFFPACDVLTHVSGLDRLNNIIRFSRTSVNIVKLSFLLSMIYNIIGLTWAVTGNLSPVFAAILMPVSSISVIAFAVGATSVWARWKKI